MRGQRVSSESGVRLCLRAVQEFFDFAVVFEMLRSSTPDPFSSEYRREGEIECNQLHLSIEGQINVAFRSEKIASFGHFSLIAGVSHDKMRELTAFSFSYSATDGTRTRLWLLIEYEYRFTEYEYDFDMIDTDDQREVSTFGSFAERKKTFKNRTMLRRNILE